MTSLGGLRLNIHRRVRVEDSSLDARNDRSDDEITFVDRRLDPVIRKNHANRSEREGTLATLGPSNHAQAYLHDGNVILTYSSDDEDDGDWIEGEGILSSLVSVRSELARGDLRGLYLGWLLCAQSGELDNDEVEPPVPPGLGDLSESLKSLAEFLGVDIDLLEVAARTSPSMEEPVSNPAAIRSWVARLPVEERDGFLSRLIAAEDGSFAQELLRRVLDEDVTGTSIGKEVMSGRTAGELLREADRAAEQRRLREAEKATRKRAEREQAAAMARTKYLDGIVGRESALWTEIESLIATRQPNHYDQALKLLADLRDVAARGDEAGFRERLEQLRSEHAGKPSLMKRMRDARL